MSKKIWYYSVELFPNENNTKDRHEKALQKKKYVF